MNKTINSESKNNSSDKWWMLIGILAAFAVALPIVATISPPDAYDSLITAPFAIIGGILTLLSPLIVYYDKKFVNSVTEWNPTGWYYLMILPPLTLILPFVYLYERHKYVGVP